MSVAKTCIETTCSGAPPTAASAATTFAAARSNCSTTVAPLTTPSASCATWPPRKTSRPGAATTACA
jgi:hypothetical protein